jgi:crossover junction endodeoxyribonuclease RuvC
MIILGIDPGLTGAISALCTTRGLLDVADLPTCSNGLESGKMLRWLDARKLSDILAHWSERFEFGKEDVQAVIERPIAMPGQQISTAASNFDSQGALRTVMELRGFRPQFITPNDWKKLFGVGKDKDASRKAALTLYPNAPVTRAKDHNRAEAILIARYGMRTMF